MLFGVMFTSNQNSQDLKLFLIGGRRCQTLCFNYTDDGSAHALWLWQPGAALNIPPLQCLPANRTARRESPVTENTHTDTHRQVHKVMHSFSQLEISNYDNKCFLFDSNNSILHVCHPQQHTVTHWANCVRTFCTLKLFTVSPGSY